MQNDQLLSLNTIEYDFEDYAYQHGIPETLDPLPYRKAGSVFSNDIAEPVLTSAKHDPRLRTVVCRHWLRDLCMKGAACEFLHQYDLNKMPLCRHGERCKIRDCPFRHIREGDRMECAFYKSGFCIHGPFCRYKHLKRPREELPIVADFTLGLSQMQASKDGEKVTRRPAAKPNEFYKLSLCKHFMMGDCPFGEGCHFAHGKEDLRSLPRKGQDDGDDEDEENKPETVPTDKKDYFQGGAAGGGKPCPILEPDQSSFFLVSAATQRDLALSTVRGEWYIQAKHVPLVSNGLESGTRQVLIFFTVCDSRHIQGAALVTSPCVYQKALDSDTESFCYRFGVEWYRTTEFPVATALNVAPDLLLPTKATQFCQDLSRKTGESIMKALWNSPLVTLYESWSEDAEEPPAADKLLTDFRAPSPNDIAWPVMPGPGYIFGCSSDTMDECLGRGIFGVPAHMASTAAVIAPGSAIFLFNVTDRLVFGIFEALTPATTNIEPSAFSRNPNATSSPFPVQIRVRIALECPPLEDTDPLFNDILRSRGRGRIGPLTHGQTEAIATLLAQQCGALDYMVQYRRDATDGRPVRAPPIALPPRKIEQPKKREA